MPPDASTLWTWVYIALGLALVPLWWRVLLQEDLEVDRSLRPEDVQVTDGVLLQDRRCAKRIVLATGIELAQAAE